MTILNKHCYAIGLEHNCQVWYAPYDVGTPLSLDEAWKHYILSAADKIKRGNRGGEMALKRTEALLDAITAAKAMNRDEGKKSSVVLLHPFVLDPVMAELSVTPEELSPHESFDPAPEIAGLRVVRDETIPVDEVCVLSDEDYLEHERRKAQDS